MKATINETMAELWWNSVPKERQNAMTGLLYGIRIMVDYKMIIEMYQIFGK